MSENNNKEPEKDENQQEKEEGLKVRPKLSSSEYEVIGINPDYPERIIIKSSKEDLIGTVNKEGYDPVDTTWEEIEKKFLKEGKKEETNA